MVIDQIVAGAPRDVIRAAIAVDRRIVVKAANIVGTGRTKDRDSTRVVIVCDVLEIRNDGRSAYVLIRRVRKIDDGVGGRYGECVVAS